MIKVSTVAFKARTALGLAGVSFAHTEALELVAASLGYGTYAALKLDPAVDVNNLLAEADHAILQPDHLETRVKQLGKKKPVSIAVDRAIVGAFREVADETEHACRFHDSMQDFKDFIFEDVQARALQDDDVANAYAETNAYIDEFYTDHYLCGQLLDSDDEWTLVASGSHTGEVDPERPYSGHADKFTATYTFQKDGRCGLIELDLQFELDLEEGFDQEE